MARKIGQIIAVRDQTWMVRIPLGRDLQTKKRNYYNRTIHGSLRQAQQFLNRKADELGANRQTDGGKIRLNQYLDDWLGTIKGRVQEKTYEDYVALLAKHVRPRLGKKLLVGIKPLEIQNVYQQMTEQGLSAATVQHVHWVLNAAYRQAVQWEMVVSAPTAKLKLPRIRRREMQVLSIEQSKAFIKVALPTLYGTLETVAIVGLNGSGKSTIGLLATRLYQPESGAIFLGRQDIREISLRGLRSIVTLVPQDPVLFDETVRENLLYGKPSATDGDLDKVAAQTQLDQVLQKLPAGLDEPLGPLGNRLSGGEKKRVALARTLLQTPNVLILDEITSALDEPAARDLLHGLDLFRKARTLIIISHRPTTILWADRILVIGEGAVVDSGTHAQLISRCALYQRIWKSQDIYSNSTHTL